jgi:hypothetical protein
MGWRATLYAFRTFLSGNPGLVPSVDTSRTPRPFTAETSLAEAQVRQVLRLSIGRRQEFQNAPYEDVMANRP